MRKEIDIPDEVTVTMDHLELTVEGTNGSVTRRLWYPDIAVTVDGDAVVIESDDDNAKTNSTVGTFESHVRNMLYGVTDGWEYNMEVFYSHFPMQVSVQDGEVVIENFLGERAPRRTPIRGDTEVSVDGEELTISGPNIEDVGQTAADIEQLTRVSDKDTRVFQDGVYITGMPDRGEAK
ncbi:MAG: 50S ribosomal protein L6 [Natronomonas sp.]|jgi:large subunit ribosomal protein L6|uniref:Large ribosomal subunit protein uL6 n=1 Tax=Natronomonas salsuginis TaxID=2217661 RepID=A0A4U5JJ08_9EURY|nr:MULTISPECIES: 50S ribosomal protein L6 [Natronomonas]MDR9380247.1 50S ribosomal protein L6 [Natronomonas sp.]MDR9430689.1 50S ribosomal protein L6 [Natronomonas sp.]TKR26079.1 50S ribosomal protein L6 [Natronomonas salsuginis]